MTGFNLPKDPIHLGLLKKFQSLKNETFYGRTPIKGQDESGLPADCFVPEPHRLHDLVRGFYKPKGWECMLSYLATEKDDNYGQQITWQDKESGKFSRILMRPPASPRDKRVHSDINAGRYAMNHKIPIGIIKNIDKGVNRCLGLGVITEELEDGSFVVEPVDLTDQISDNSDDIRDARRFFIIRTKEEEIVEVFLNGASELEIGGLYQHAAITKKGDVVFLVLGGDNPPWDTGLKAICTVLEEPYNHGYDRKNPRYFKVKLKVEIMLEHSITREDLVPYRDCYNITFIGPMTKWEPNQANQLIADGREIYLVRAVLDFFPSIEDKLKNVFGEEFIEKAKDTEAEILVSKKLKYGETPKLSQMKKEESTATEWNPDITTIIGSMNMDEDPIRCMQTMVNMGKNIILMGPPGTGKTTIAENACREAVRLGYIANFITTTATADWTTFDTIGGYMPDKKGSLKFVEGLILRSIRNNSWLVIDEINRSEADKAFGQIFTVLSKRPVVLPFEDEAGRTYRIDFTDSLTSYFDSSEGVYYFGRNWRIIATMNTFDKNSLFALSYAFMRRFAFVEIPIPKAEFMHNLIDSISDSEQVRHYAKHILKISPKPLGPALIKELTEYLNKTWVHGAASGLTALILPQYEGLSRQQLIDFYQQAVIYLPLPVRASLKESMADFFDIGTSYFEKADLRNEVADTESNAEAEDESNED